MKKAVSFLAILILSSSGVIQVFSQKVHREQTLKGPIELKAAPIDKSETTTRFSTTEAFSDGTRVVVRWSMEAERGNVGFYVYRIDLRGRNLVSDVMTPGSAFKTGDFPLNGEIYTLLDAEGTSESVYTIEAVDRSSKRINSTTFSTQTVDDLKNLFDPNIDSVIRRKDIDVGRLQENDLVLPKEVLTEIENNSLAPNIDTHRSVISQPGVRIGVRKQGVYRITRDELSAGGFNVNTDPNLWQLYTEGNEQAIILGPNADYVEFYGTGIDTIESDTRTYYLINAASAGKRMGSRVIRPNGSTVVAPGYYQTFVLKERTFYVGNILNGDADNFWGRPITETPSTLAFNLSGVDFASPNSSLGLKFQGFSTGFHEVRLVLNGEILSSVLGVGQAPFSRGINVPTSFLREGANTLEMTAIGPTGDYNLFDSIDVSFRRQHMANQSTLPFYTQNSRAARVRGFSSANVRVFDITEEGSPNVYSNVIAQPDNGTFRIEIPAARGRLLYAVEDSAILPVVSITQNNTENLRTTAHAANLVIIAYKDWMTEAETWANYRRNQGTVVKVVDVNEIFDEFNYGVAKADAMRDFLAYANNNWGTAPGYVLMLGDTSLDPRNYLGFGFSNFVPTRMVNTIFNETGSDEYLADFNGDGLAEMAVGRIAARSGSTISTVLSKVTNWEQNLGANPLSRGVLFTHDLPDGYDFAGLNGRLRNQLPVGTPTTMISRGDPNPNPAIIASINAGKYFVNYSGHGSVGAWANSGFFSNNHVPQLTNVNSLPVFTMLTCQNGYFLSVVGVSLAENLVQSPIGGGVAAWASTGLTTPDLQEIMATRFYNRLGAGTIPRMGDLVRDAKTTIPGGTDVRLSWALLGDPMLKIR
ncbi:MAG: C25 family cysteine peptidase [Blastocatellia bacterium]